MKTQMWDFNKPWHASHGLTTISLYHVSVYPARPPNPPIYFWKQMALLCSLGRGLYDNPRSCVVFRKLKTVMRESESILWKQTRQVKCGTVCIICVAIYHSISICLSPSGCHGALGLEAWTLGRLDRQKCNEIIDAVGATPVSDGIFGIREWTRYNDHVFN